MTIVTSRWPPYPLPYTRGQNCEPGLSELIVQSGANLATLYGHINGGETVGGQPNSAPRNPSGDFGHDHSGGDFGRPLFRSVCTVTSDNGDPTSSSAIVGALPGNSMKLADGDDSSTTTSAFFTVPFWVPPCDPRSGAYVELGLAARLRLLNTGLLAGDTLTIEAWSQWTNEEAVKVSFAVSAPNSTGIKDISSGASTKIRVQQGAVNLFRYQAKAVRTTGGSARGAEILLQELDLGVYSV